MTLPPDESLETTPDAVMKSLVEHGVRNVHVGLFDLDASLRERRLPLAVFERALREGMRFVNVLHQWDTADQVDPQASRFVDEAVAIDADSGRPYAFESDAALFVADYAGESAGLSPRELLKRQVAHARRLGFGVRAALEFEFIVLAEDADSLRESGFTRLTPWPRDNRCWAGLTAATHAGFVADLDACLRAMDIAPYSLGLELGPGCFEVTLQATDALRAADEAALLRTFIKAFCRQRGMTASFMAQLSSDFPGLSGHVHLSLHELDSGRALFHDAAREYRMSREFRDFCAGLLTLLPEASALLAHTVNAYRRMLPGNWAPRTPSWGLGNYTTALRVLSSEAETARLEFRVPGADTNPHLAIATTLAAGLHGIESAAADTPCTLPAPVAGDGRLADTGGVTLPASLDEAATRLDASAALRTLFGDRFIDHFVRTRRLEVDAFRRHVSAFERARYLEAL